MRTEIKKNYSLGEEVYCLINGEKVLCTVSEFNEIPSLPYIVRVLNRNPEERHCVTDDASVTNCRILGRKCQLIDDYKVGDKVLVYLNVSEKEGTIKKTYDNLESSMNNYVVEVKMHGETWNITVSADCSNCDARYIVRKIEEENDFQERSKKMKKLKDLKIGEMFKIGNEQIYRKTNRGYFEEEVSCGRRATAILCVIEFSDDKKCIGKMVEYNEEIEVYPVEQSLNDNDIEAYYRDWGDYLWTSDLLTFFTESFVNLYKAILDEKADGQTIARKIVDMEDVLGIIRRKHTSQDAYDKAYEGVLKDIEEWKKEKNVEN